MGSPSGAAVTNGNIVFSNPPNWTRVIMEREDYEQYEKLRAQCVELISMLKDNNELSDKVESVKQIISYFAIKRLNNI